MAHLDLLALIFTTHQSQKMRRNPQLRSLTYARDARFFDRINAEIASSKGQLSKLNGANLIFGITALVAL